MVPYRTVPVWYRPITRGMVPYRTVPARTVWYHPITHGMTTSTDRPLPSGLGSSPTLPATQAWLCQCIGAAFVGTAHLVLACVGNCLYRTAQHNSPTTGDLEAYLSAGNFGFGGSQMKVPSNLMPFLHQKRWSFGHMCCADVKLSPGLKWFWR